MTVNNPIVLVMKHCEKCGKVVPHCHIEVIQEIWNRQVPCSVIEYDDCTICNAVEQIKYINTITTA